MLSADQEWENFLKDDTLQDSKDENNTTLSSFVPKVPDIYISTQTKIAYLNQTINLKDVIGKLDVIDDKLPKHGIINKEIKLSSVIQEDSGE